MIVVGFGCRKGCPSEAIIAAAALAFQRAGLDPAALDLLCAPAFKQAETGLAEAAAQLGKPLVLISEEAIAAAQARVATTSDRVALLVGHGSIAEACALAGAGPTGRLIAPRLAHDGATCAIATT